MFIWTWSVSNSQCMHTHLIWEGFYRNTDGAHVCLSPSGLCVRLSAFGSVHHCSEKWATSAVHWLRRTRPSPNNTWSNWQQSTWSECVSVKDGLPVWQETVFCFSHLQQFTAHPQAADLRRWTRPDRLHKHTCPVSSNDSDAVRQTDAFGRGRERQRQSEKQSRGTWDKTNMMKDMLMLMKGSYRGEDDEGLIGRVGVTVITSGGKSWDGKELHELNRHESESSTTHTHPHLY